MITDKLLQALGLDKSFYGYIKQFSNEQPIECEDPPSDPHFRTTPAYNFTYNRDHCQKGLRPALFIVTNIMLCDPSNRSEIGTKTMNYCLIKVYGTCIPCAGIL